MTPRLPTVVALLALLSVPLHAEPEGARLPGVVFVVEGIGGWDVMHSAVHWSLPRAGVSHEIRSFVWTHGKGQMFRDLQDLRHMLRKARVLADEVTEYHLLHPERPIYLLGKSGGSGVVLEAAALLPPATLERIILLSAAVTPGYDLRPALRATRGEIISFHSQHDQFILGWGTQQFGTIDRHYGRSAGLTGFVIPDDLSMSDRELYQRLVQIPWSADMILDGYLGRHIGTSMPGFMAKEVAPWLMP